VFSGRQDETFEYSSHLLYVNEATLRNGIPPRSAACLVWRIVSYRAGVPSHA
jgi:hypothetical protein